MGGRSATAARFAACAIAVVLIATGCFSESKRSSPDPRTPLQDALQIRAERLMAGDVEGFLQYLNPVAREAEDRIGRGALMAEVSGLEFVLGESEPSPNGGLDRVEVEWVYRYRGVPDDNVFRFRRLYRTEPQGNSVLIVESADDPASIPPLWATGDVTIARSAHFLVLLRGAYDKTDQFLQAAEEARVELLPKLEVEPLEADDVHVAVLARSTEEYRDYLRRRYVPMSVAAAGSQLRAGGAENREIVVDGSAVLEDAPVAYEDRSDVPGAEIIRHELGHLVLARFTGSTTPAWVKEGAAMFLSGERREPEWALQVDSGFADLSLGRLRTASSLYVAEYPYANAAVLYLIEQQGARIFWEFYQAIRHTGIDVALNRYYQTQDDRLDAQVQEWIRKQVAPR